jgi:hypothetical protein
MSDEKYDPRENLKRAREHEYDLRRRRAERGMSVVPERKPIVYQNFDVIDFVAFCQQIKYNARGDAVITLVVPRQYAAAAAEIPATIGTAIQVTFDKWRPTDVIGGNARDTNSGAS